MPKPSGQAVVARFRIDIMVKKSGAPLKKESSSSSSSSSSDDEGSGELAARRRKKVVPRFAKHLVCV